MNYEISNIIASLIKYEISGEELKPEMKKNISDFGSLYIESKDHDIVHLVADALIKNEIISNKGEYHDKFNKQRMLSVYRTENTEYEYMNICSLLNKNNIKFIPMKGSILKKYYPEIWMRTSCDIDILIKEEDFEKAEKCLLQNSKYKRVEKSLHEVSFESNAGIKLELHFSLIEEGRVNAQIGSVLSKVWEHSFPTAEKPYMYVMDDEMFYFYHIAHIAKHFEYGGCGIRPIIDLWILDNAEHNEDNRNKLLEEGNLLTFANNVRKLSRVYFNNEKADSLIDWMREYIENGGMYGNIENRVKFQQTKKGGKTGYILSRIFMPYRLLKTSYPILQNHPVLTPIYEVVRWFRIIFLSRSKKSSNELKVSRSMTNDELKKFSENLKEIGL